MVTSKQIELFYGQSGTGKSEAAAAVAVKLFQETGKKTRVLVGDGSAATYEALVEAGIAEMMDYTIRDWPLSTLAQLCDGYWPADVDDPKSKMIAMTPQVFDTLGCYIIEGLAVASGYIMGDKKGGLAQRAAQGEKIGQDSPFMITDVDRNAAGMPIAGSGTGLVFGGNPLSHFSVAQKRIVGFVEKSKGLPGWVIWTSHERMAEDKNSGQKLIGPEVAGGALTPVISRHFNDTLHFATVEKTVKEKDEFLAKQTDTVDAEYRIYTRDHFRTEGGFYTKYKAVTRHPDPTGKLYGGKPMPESFTADEPGVAILAFYRELKDARLKKVSVLMGAKAA